MDCCIYDVESVFCKDFFSEFVRSGETVWNGWYISGVTEERPGVKRTLGFSASGCEF